jgi:hypothetical protein
MKESSSSSVDAELLPFDDAAVLALVVGMKISSSSSLSAVHKKICFAAYFRYDSLLCFCFFHLPCNLRSSFCISSKVLEGHPHLDNARLSSFSRVSLLISTSHGTILLSILKLAAKCRRHLDILG